MTPNPIPEFSPPPPESAVPLPASLKRYVNEFDVWAEAKLDNLRGHPVVDRVFYVATELGDFSVLWHIINAARGLRSDEDADNALRIMVLLMGESVLVNGVIKSFFRRTRPAWDQPRAHNIRKPRSSSFPSGHASAAFTAAGLLSEGRGGPVKAMYYGLAAVVATSRAYVKIHHPSDVLAGVATGVVLAKVAKRVSPSRNARTR